MEGPELNYKTEVNRVKDPLLNELYPQVTSFVEERLAQIDGKNTVQTAGDLLSFLSTIK